MWPPIKTNGANITPTTGIILSHNPVKMLTVIAIPPVERQSANSLAYDNRFPKNPVRSMRPNAPLKYMSIIRLKTSIGAAIYNELVSTYATIPASKTNQIICAPKASLTISTGDVVVCTY